MKEQKKEKGEVDVGNGKRRQQRKRPRRGERGERGEGKGKSRWETQRGAKVYEVTAAGPFHVSSTKSRSSPKQNRV